MQYMLLVYEPEDLDQGPVGQASLMDVAARRAQWPRDPAAWLWRAAWRRSCANPLWPSGSICSGGSRP